MNGRNILRISAVAALGIALLAGSAVAQKKPLKELLVGTWLAATVDNVRPDGSRFQSLGSNPKGILMFDANGWFSFSSRDSVVQSSHQTIGCRVQRRRTRPLWKEASRTTENTRWMSWIWSFTLISKVVHIRTSTALITSESSRRSRTTS